MELCERGSLLDLIRKPENITGIDEDEFLRAFSHLGMDPDKVWKMQYLF